MAPSPALTAAPGARVAPAAAPLLYRLLREPVRALLERLLYLRVEGQGYLPRSGPYIVAANHHNYLDALVLAVSVPLPIRFLVMPRVYRATPLHPWLHRRLGSIPLRLDRADVGALRRALAVLGAGGVVGIFPEGPFSVRGRLEPGLPGVALLALRSGAPVIPAAIRGTYQALVGRRAYLPRRHPVTVRFGPPRRFAPAPPGARRVARRQVTERIMADIAALLA
jgi:1-acyl-sn-glycerol-3-phosphate acyltransferase